MKGIYRIFNLVTGDYYVGSTMDSFSRRFANHRADLRRNKHCNPLLQRSWNKYGENNFKFVPVEILGDNQLIMIAEQSHLDLCLSDPKCFNVLPIAGTTAGRTCSEEAIRNQALAQAKKCVLISPEGERVEIVNISEFAKKLGIDNSALCKVVGGKLKSYKGWHSVESIKLPRREPSTRGYFLHSSWD